MCGVVNLIQVYQKVIVLLFSAWANLLVVIVTYDYHHYSNICLLWPPCFHLMCCYKFLSLDDVHFTASDSNTGWTYLNNNIQSNLTVLEERYICISSWCCTQSYSVIGKTWYDTFMLLEKDSWWRKNESSLPQWRQTLSFTESKESY